MNLGVEVSGLMVQGLGFRVESWGLSSIGSVLKVRCFKVDG